MSDAEAHNLPTEQQARTNRSRKLHKQAEQMSRHAEQLDDDASAAHAEADDMSVEAAQVREWAQHLHEQGDKASEGT